MSFTDYVINKYGKQFDEERRTKFKREDYKRALESTKDFNRQTKSYESAVKDVRRSVNRTTAFGPQPFDAVNTVNKNVSKANEKYKSLQSAALRMQSNTGYVDNKSLNQKLNKANKQQDYISGVGDEYGQYKNTADYIAERDRRIENNMSASQIKNRIDALSEQNKAFDRNIVARNPYSGGASVIDSNRENIDRNNTEISRLTKLYDTKLNTETKSKLESSALADPQFAEKSREYGNLTDLDEYKPLDYATDQERAIANYYINTGKGNEYYNTIYNDLQQRKEAESLQNAQGFAERHPIIASLGSIEKNIAGGIIATGENLVDAGMGREPNQYDTGSQMLKTANTERQTVTDSINNNIGKFLYNTGMSIGDFAIAAPLGNAALPVFGMNAAANYTDDAVKRGATKEQAYIGGIAAGAAEALFEKFSIGNIFKTLESGGANTVKQALKQTLIQSGVEASEETATEITNALTDKIIMGDLSNYDLSVKNYMAQGMSEQDANKQATIDIAMNVGQAALGGFISGGAIGGVVGGVQLSQNRAVNRRLQNDVQEAAKNGIPYSSVVSQIENLYDENTRQTINFDGLQTEYNNAVVEDAYTNPMDATIGRVVNYPDIRKAFENKAGITLQGNEMQMRQTVKNAIENKTTETNSKFSIETLPNGKKYVQADRQVIKGDNPTEWKKQVYNHINQTIRNGKDVVVYAPDGDALTITEDTAGKARFRNVVTLKDGSKRTMTDDEFAVKLRAESHIDELSQVSTRGKNDVPDYKNHDFAKDGFNYRTAYFRDLDGGYYRLTLSVGKNGLINTVYNVGKIKETDAPLMAQRPTRNNAEGQSVFNTNISQPDNGVNSSIRQSTEDDTQVKKSPEQINQDKQRIGELSKAMGVKVQWFKDNSNIHGYANKGVVYLNENSNNNVYTTLSHEITHSLEKLNRYNLIREWVKKSPEYKSLLDNASDEGITHQQYIELVQMQYSEYGKDLTESQAEQEIVANFISTTLFDNEQAIKSLARDDHGLWNYIKNHIRYLINRIKGNSNLSRELQKVESLYIKAYQQVNINDISDNDTRFSLGDAQKDIQALVKKYGKIKPGVNPVRDIEVPQKTSDGKKTMRAVRTILESDSITDDMVEDINEEIIKEVMSYEPISNKYTVAEAERIINGSISAAKLRWDQAVTSDKVASAQDIAIAEILLKRAAQDGDKKEVLKIMTELSTEATKAGQAVQAIAILKKLTGAGKLYAVKKSIDKINSEYSKKFPARGNKSSKFKPVKINEDLAIKLAKAKTEEKVEAVTVEIYKDIAAQLPSSIPDKINAWRYMAMLMNPKTHIRNILGNAIFVPAVSIKDRLFGVGLEKIYKKFINKDYEATKAFNVDKKYKDYASADFDKHKDNLLSTGKYNFTNEVEKYKSVYDTKALEYLRTLNETLLDKEDAFFLKNRYVSAMGQYLQANKVDISNLDKYETYSRINKARAYASTEALKATYRDASALATALNNLTKIKGVNLIVEGVLPFKKTPANILKRGIEYSPVGLLKSLTYDYYRLRRGNINANEYIDNLASGLTGSAIFLLGVFMASMGVIKGGFGDDKEDKFNKLQGEQQYSIQIGKMSFTIDWMAPSSMPFLIGAETMNILKGADERVTFTSIAEKITAISEPVINLSMLQGLNNTIETAKYADNAITEMAQEAVVSLGGQFVPTIFGQLARTIDKTQRRTYIYPDSSLPQYIQRGIQNNIKKLPGFSMLNEPMVNMWGEEQKEDNVFIRAVENFISPSYISKLRDKSLFEQTILDLKSKAKDDRVFPNYMDKKFSYNNKEKVLTAQEYTEYSKVSGSMALVLGNKLVQSPAFNSLSDTQKVDAIDLVYTYSKKYGKSSVAEDYMPNTLEKWTETADELYQKGLPIENYICYRVGASDVEGIKSEATGKTISGTLKSNKFKYIDNMDIPTEQQYIIKRSYK